MRNFAVAGPVYLLPLTPMSIAVYHLLKKHAIPVAGFCDNSPHYAGTNYQSIPCVTPREAVQKHPDAVFIIPANHGRVRAELLEEAKRLSINALPLEGILEKGDMDSILPDIAEDEARALLCVPSVRDLAEIQQFYYIFPQSWSADKKIVDAIFLPAYRDMRQDFDALAASENFIRHVVIKIESPENCPDILRHIRQSGKNIGIIEIFRFPASAIPLRNSINPAALSMPSYVTSHSQGILSRKITGIGIPIEIKTDGLYPRIFEETKAIFIHIPKNSGSTLRKIFFRGITLPHAPARYYRNIDASKFKSYFSFSLSRNPWDRLVSGYIFCRENYLRDGILDAFRKLCASASFKEMIYALRDDTDRLFLRHDMISPQYEWVCDENGKIMVDYIGRFENLPESYAQIAQGMGIPFDGSIPHANASRHRPYQDYYDAETKAIVGELFKTDIELFGYKFD